MKEIVINLIHLLYCIMFIFWLWILIIYLTDSIIYIISKIKMRQSYIKRLKKVICFILAFVILVIIIGFVQATILFGINLFMWLAEIIPLAYKSKEFTLTNVVLRIVQFRKNLK